MLEQFNPEELAIEETFTWLLNFELLSYVVGEDVPKVDLSHNLHDFDHANLVFTAEVEVIVEDVLDRVGLETDNSVEELVCFSSIQRAIMIAIVFRALRCDF
jgi:hypothetical protein